MRAIAIEQNNASGKLSYWEGGDHQSEADRDGVSLAPYIHALYGFLVQARARNVLMIGAAGGTLATMLHRRGVAVTMVDISPAAFAIARRYFGLPADVACHIADGARFLKARRPASSSEAVGRKYAPYDAIVLDAFVEDQIPAVFWKKRFFQVAKKRLRRGGMFLANIIVKDDADSTPDRFCRLMHTAWRDVRLLDTDGYVDRNAVIVAGKVRALKRPRLLLAPRQRRKQIAAELKGLTFRALR